MCHPDVRTLNRLIYLHAIYVPSKGQSRGFAFVTMSNADEHAAAIDSMNETELGGRTIYVSESLPKEMVKKNKEAYKSRKQSKSLLFIIAHEG